MKREIIKTDAAPAAIGPYSQAVTADNLVFISGQLGIDPATGEMPESVADQTKLALNNLDAILTAAGSSAADVVKTTVLLADMGDFALVNELYGNYFPSPYPARACFAVKTLPKNGKVEIECVAIRR
ncbi:MAG: RidA family protein [Eubacteriales bacterium]|nr:RidA family protein [Eubacteriales bacterium]MDD4323631.1 RidA family protein [Eubacteriales bacterium]MDD4540629.1 RidA family protein [Eubacteriales bacterium]